MVLKLCRFDVLYVYRVSRLRECMHYKLKIINVWDRVEYTHWLCTLYRRVEDVECENDDHIVPKITNFPSVQTLLESVFQFLDAAPFITLRAVRTYKFSTPDSREGTREYDRKIFRIMKFLGVKVIAFRWSEFCLVSRNTRRILYGWFRYSFVGVMLLFYVAMRLSSTFQILPGNPEGSERAESFSAHRSHPLDGLQGSWIFVYMLAEKWSWNMKPKCRWKNLWFFFRDASTRRYARALRASSRSDTPLEVRIYYSRKLHHTRANPRVLSAGKGLWTCPFSAVQL